MKTIVISKMELSYFKGVKKLNVDFREHTIDGEVFINQGSVIEKQGSTEKQGSQKQSIAEKQFISTKEQFDKLGSQSANDKIAPSQPIGEILRFNSKGGDLSTFQRIVIGGKNGCGKSTIQDAFMWLLFGKNSDDKKVFTIKTCDRYGRVIPRLEHKVSAVLMVDGKDVKLTRVYKEKYVKKRGEIDETFAGNTEELYYNDVPQKTAEYTEKITRLIMGESKKDFRIDIVEDLFKYMTHPLYFTSRKEEVQRYMLFKMAGEVSDDDVIAKDHIFSTLQTELQGKTIEEYKREIAAKKRTLKTAAQNLPDRMQELQDATPVVKDWAAVETEKNALRKEVDAIDSKLADACKVSKYYQDEIDKTTTQLATLQTEMVKRETELQKIAAADYAEMIRKANEVNATASRLNTEIQTKEKEVAYLTDKYYQHEKTCKEYSEKYLSELNKKFDFAADPICPTCGRPFTTEELQNAMTAAEKEYNKQKAERLQKLVDDGKKELEMMKSLQADIDRLKSEISLLKTNEIQTIDIAEIKQPQVITIADEKYCEIQNLFNAKNDDLAKLIETAENEKDDHEIVDRLMAEKADLQKMIDDKISILATREIIDRNGKRLAELKTEYQNYNETIADLEMIEFRLEYFTKTKAKMMQEKVDALFHTIKWKLFDTQVNGAVVETCTATIGGVPFADANNAAKINAGLEIIEVFTQYAEMAAPVFIDNAESVNTLRQTTAQQIQLVVTGDDHLTML